MFDIALALQTAQTVPRDPRRQGPESVYANIRPATETFARTPNQTSFAGGAVWALLRVAPARPITAIIEGESRTFDTLEEKYAALAHQWRRFNRGKSVINYAHYAYFQVLTMGWDAVPFMLRDVAAGAGTWYPALQYIAGEMPEPLEARGDAKAVRRAWLEWGRRNGYWGKPEITSGDDRTDRGVVAESEFR